jgi:peptidoglycan/xylan/chitin deacetylase (PgdA/CDA1 family)
MAFPSTVDRIKHDAIDGIIKPAIHGWEHIDYNALSDKDVREHLSNCISWFRDYLWYTPTLWCTPWGADSPKLREIAGEFGLTVEGTAGWVEPGEWLQHAREGRLDPRLMWHWWERGQKLLKVVEVIKAGSYKEAAKTRLDLFG